jgi:NADPH:quinone reductase-like Zn-dependent oxidoreductase
MYVICIFHCYRILFCTSSHIAISRTVKFEQMKAAVVKSFSEPPVYTTFDKPQATQPNEVLINVRASPVHNLVRSIADGTHYTSTGKVDFVAGVDGVGTRATDGKRVYFAFGTGAMAEQTVVDAAQRGVVIELPDSIDDATAAGIAVPGMSSCAGLNRGNFAAGDSVLIIGATGVAGVLAVQIAKARGARHVTVTGRDAAMLEKLKTMGADTAISLTQPAEKILADLRGVFAGVGVDVVLDYVWGTPAEQVLNVIGQRGSVRAGHRVRFVQIGNMAGAHIQLSAAILRGADVQLIGSGVGSLTFAEVRASMAEVFTLYAKKPLEFAVKTAPLSQVRELWKSTANDKTRLVFMV